MAQALQEAETAGQLDEVPIGAVILKGDEIIGRGHNRVRTDQDPTAHAEMVAIRDAAGNRPSGRLEGCALFVTMEPCAMCSGAIVLSRLARVVFGAPDPKAGACGSLRNIVTDPRLNHRVELVAGFQRGLCGELLKSFFRAKRQ